jgi:hypothetical protein
MYFLRGIGWDHHLDLLGECFELRYHACLPTAHVLKLAFIQDSLNVKLPLAALEHLNHVHP